MCVSVCVDNVRPSIVHPSKHPAYAYKSNLVGGPLPSSLATNVRKKKYERNLIIFYVFSSFSFSFSLSLSVSCYSYSWMTTRPSEKLTWNQRNAEQKVEGRPSKRNRQKAMAKQSETKQEMSQRNEKWNKWETTTTTTQQHGKICGTQAIKNGGKGSQGHTHTWQTRLVNWQRWNENRRQWMQISVEEFTAESSSPGLIYFYLRRILRHFIWLQIF